MSFCTYLLGRAPDYQKKLQQELDDVLGPPPTRRPITVDDLQQMKYLERCIKESLRMAPSVPMFARPVTEEIKCG